LMEQRCEEMGVADGHGELDQDIVISEPALLETGFVRDCDSNVK